MLAYGPSEAPLTSPIQSRERSRSLYHRRRVLHTSSGPPLLSSCGTDRAVRKHRHMVAKREDTEVVSQCHVGRGAYPVDCHHLARRLDDDQVLELEDMFDQDTCRLSWGARDRRSVHRWEDQDSPRRIGAFVYTVGLRAAPRGRDSVHRWGDRGSLRQFWAFVYTVVSRAPLRTTRVYTDGGIGPLRAGFGRLCTLLNYELWAAPRRATFRRRRRASRARQNRCSASRAWSSHRI